MDNASISLRCDGWGAADNIECTTRNTSHILTRAAQQLHIDTCRCKSAENRVCIERIRTCLLSVLESSRTAPSRLYYAPVQPINDEKAHLDGECAAKGLQKGSETGNASNRCSVTGGKARQYRYRSSRKRDLQDRVMTQRCPSSPQHSLDVSPGHMILRG